MTTIGTTAGDIYIQAGPVRTYSEDAGTTYEVAIRVTLGERTVCGDATIGEDERASGNSVDCWLSPGIRALLDAEVPEVEHGTVLGEIEAVASSRVHTHVEERAKRTLAGKPVVSVEVEVAS